MKLWFKLIYTKSVRILTDVISGTEVHQQHQKRQIQDYQNKDRFSVIGYFHYRKNVNWAAQTFDWAAGWA